MTREQMIDEAVRRTLKAWEKPGLGNFTMFFQDIRREFACISHA